MEKLKQIYNFTKYSEFSNMDEIEVGSIVNQKGSSWHIKVQQGFISKLLKKRKTDDDDDDMMGLPKRKQSLIKQTHF